MGMCCQFSRLPKYEFQNLDAISICIAKFHKFSWLPQNLGAISIRIARFYKFSWLPQNLGAISIRIAKFHKPFGLRHTFRVYTININT